VATKVSLGAHSNQSIVRPLWPVHAIQEGAKPMTKTDLPCGYIRPASRPKLRLVKIDSMDPAQVIPVGSVAIVARQLARQHVRQEAQRRGEKWMYLADLPLRASEYFKANRQELMRLAYEKLKSW